MARVRDVASPSDEWASVCWPAACENASIRTRCSSPTQTGSDGGAQQIRPMQTTPGSEVLFPAADLAVDVSHRLSFSRRRTLLDCCGGTGSPVGCHMPAVAVEGLRNFKLGLVTSSRN